MKSRRKKAQHSIRNCLKGLKWTETLSLIKEIQHYLNKLGYKAGPIDGLLGDKTTSALKRFSERTKQKRPAEISYRQVEALKEVYFGEIN